MATIEELQERAVRFERLNTLLAEVAPRLAAAQADNAQAVQSVQAVIDAAAAGVAPGAGAAIDAGVDLVDIAALRTTLAVREADMAQFRRVLDAASVAAAEVELDCARDIDALDFPPT